MEMKRKAMPGEEQECFEDYLGLEHFISEIQASHAAYPFQKLTPAQMHVYGMALLFHAATPGVSEPGVEFAARLQTLLEQAIRADKRT